MKIEITKDDKGILKINLSNDLKGSDTVNMLTQALGNLMNIVEIEKDTIDVDRMKKVILGINKLIDNKK